MHEREHCMGLKDSLQRCSDAAKTFTQVLHAWSMNIENVNVSNDVHKKNYKSKFINESTRGTRTCIQSNTKTKIQESKC